MSERSEKRDRRRLLALLLLLVLLTLALFLIAVARISAASPPPPLTTILSAPSDPSAERTATFKYTNLFDVSGFECSLDGATFAPCGTERPSTAIYHDLAQERHRFRVRAVSEQGVGAAASYEWTVDLSSALKGGGAGGGSTGGHGSHAGPGQSGGSASSGGGAGNGAVGNGSGGSSGDGRDGSPGDGGAGDVNTGAGGGGGGRPTEDFVITGDVPGLLYPGGPPLTIPLHVENSGTVPLRVVRLVVTVDPSSLRAGCRASWFRITQPGASSGNPLVVRGRGAVTLPAGGVTAPTIRMLDSGNQDACKLARIGLRYAGEARS